MAHTVLPGKHPNIAHLQISGTVTAEDMTCDAALGLGTGKPVYMLLEVLNINRTLPDDFAETTRIGFLVHPDLQHMAVVTESNLIRSAALIGATIASRREKTSVHSTMADAEAHLLAMIKRQGV
jgi:hypothetical protein